MLTNLDAPDIAADAPAQEAATLPFRRPTQAEFALPDRRQYLKARRLLDFTIALALFPDRKSVV